MEKTLIIGCGFLGSQIFSVLKKKNRNVIGTNFQKQTNNFIKLDITNFESIEKLMKKENPDIVINCAGNTNIDYLEKNEEIAEIVNARGAENIAINCKQNFSKLIHISTDAVFDGKKKLYTENDIPNPINVYGKSKLMGENLIKNNFSNALIIRTNMFGYNKQNKFLFNWILNSLKEKNEIFGFNDIVFNPLEISLLSELIIKLGDIKISGILHLSSDEIISKFEFCCKVASVFNLDKNLIKNGTLDDSKLIAKRPKNTSLSNLKFKKILNVRLPPINDQIIKIKKQIEEE